MNQNRMRLAAVCCFVLLASRLCADDYVWMSEPASGAWSTNAPNWNAGEVWPAAAGHTAVFGASTQRVLAVSEALDVGALRFQADGYQIGGAALAFSGSSPFVAVESAAATSLIQTAVLNDSLLSKTGPGVLRLGAAPYDGGTNVRDVAVAEGLLQVEAGRSLCSTGVWSVAAGAAYRQSGGTNLLLSGGNVFLIGQGGGESQTARVEVTGGSLSAPATTATAGANAWFVLGKERSAWFRMAESADVQVIVMEMNPDLVPGLAATLQLDGGRLTVNRLTGTAGVSGTVSRVLLNGCEIVAGGNNGAFIGDMTEAWVQTGGVTVTVPSTWYYKTQQVLSHDPALGGTPDGGLTKRGTGLLYLQANNAYTGGTRIEQGFLYVGANRALGSGPAEVGTGSSDAALVGDTGSFTVTNAVTFGQNGSVCAVTNATLALTRIAFAPGYEQIKAGGGKTDGTVKLTVDPASTTRVYNIFVYDRNTLVLDGGTVIRQTEPLTNASPRVEVRAGSRLKVLNADIQMPDISYLNLAGGEYGQAGGSALFPYVLATTNWPNSSQRDLPARVVLAGGSLTFTAAKMFSDSNRRGTETIVNGGWLKAQILNLSKSTQQTSLTHTVELNGGTLEVGGILYNGGESAVETATVRLNGGTLKVAADSTFTNDFLSVNGLNLLSVYLGSGGFVCDTAGKNVFIRNPLPRAPELGDAADGGLVKKGAGRLALTQPLELSGPVRVEEGTLSLFSLSLSGTNVSVQSGGTLTLAESSLTNATLEVASGGTLQLLEAEPVVAVTNGSFETYAAGTFSSTVKHKYQPSGTGWRFSSTCGIQTNGSGFSADPVYYTTNGGVTAFVKEGTLETDITVAREGSYRLAFEQATRDGVTYSSWLRNVEVRIDGVTVYTVRHGGALHGFRRVEIPVMLTAGTHVLTFAGLATATQNANAAVLIDAVTLTGSGPVTADLNTVLQLSAGSTLVLDNANPVYIEKIYVDGKRVYGALRAGSTFGTIVQGAGKLTTLAGGTIIAVK